GADDADFGGLGRGGQRQKRGQNQALPTHPSPGAFLLGQANAGLCRLASRQGTPLLLWTYCGMSGGLPRSATVSSQGKDKVGSLANRFIRMVSLAPAPGASRTGKLDAFTSI